MKGLNKLVQRGLPLTLAVIGLGVVLSLGFGALAQKSLVVAQPTNVPTLDPAMIGDMGPMAVLDNIYDTLLTRDSTGKIVPNIATSWKNIGGTTWEFQIRKGVKFTDGEPLDAQTVAYSLRRVMNPATKSPIQELSDFKSVDVVGPYTVDIHTTVVDPMVPANLTLFGGTIVPEQYIKEHGSQYFANHPVGSGPFKLVKWVKDDRVVLEKNPDYWKGAPKIDELTFVGIPNDGDRVSALLTGEVDIATNLPPDYMSTVNANPNTRVDSVPGLRVYYLSTAYPTGPTSNKLVRQAISYAINTKLLIDKLMNGQAVQIAAPAATTSFGFNPNLKPYPYDPQKAKQLLAQAGYPNGFTIDFATESGIYTDIAVAIQGMLQQVGIKVNLERLPSSQYSQEYATGKLPPLWNLGYTLWQGGPSVLIKTFFLKGMPRTKYSSPQLDNLINEFQSEVNLSSRSTEIQQALQILHDEAPWVYLFQANEIFGVNKRVEWTPPNNEILNMENANVTN